MAIQSTGIGSGLDVNSIISQLLAIESRPLARLQETASTTQTQLSTYGALKSRIAALGDAAEKLATAEELRRVACPVGVKIRSQTPQEIAVSIMAQFIDKRAEWLQEKAASR